MHIGSTVAGEIRPDRDAVDAVDAILPAGTLSGAPKLRACEIIQDKVPADRACGYVKNIGREGQEAVALSFSELHDAEVDMFTTVYIGNSMSYIDDGKMITRRGYSK